jgi:hypothetical protein
MGNNGRNPFVPQEEERLEPTKKGDTQDVLARQDIPLLGSN